MNTTKIITLLVLVWFSYGTCLAQESIPIPEESELSADKKWYQTFGLRGYMQARYNRLLETNPNLKCEQCDRSWGDNGGLFMRRIRVIFFGQITNNIYFYIQPDFASSASSTGLNFGQLRDAYFDIGFDNNNEYRVRIGQSKVPFGFENMQSSQNRLPLDRNDGLNSALSNERDMGVFFYYAPKEIRKKYSHFVRGNLKGSGDYGVLGFGIFNGQTANRPEMNNSLHVVARASYPFSVGNQVIEPGIQAYTGKYVLYDSQISDGVATSADKNYLDQRVAASFILYPQPFGIQAEYNIGTGPEFDKNTQTIVEKDLYGGYATLTYKWEYNKHVFFPFTRFQHYRGGKKHELDARSYNVKEMELGVEWQPNKNFELVVMYTISDRRFEDFILQDNRQSGNLLRIQAQVNF